MNNSDHENLPVVESNEVPTKKKPNRVNESAALKLFFRGWSYSEIAKHQGVTPAAIWQRLKPFTVFNKQGTDIQTFNDNKANILNGSMYKLLAIVNDEDKLKEMSPYQAAGSFGIMYDKYRLETGESTSNVNLLSAIVIGSEKLHKQGYSEPVIADIKQEDT